MEQRGSKDDPRRLPALPATFPEKCVSWKHHRPTTSGVRESPIQTPRSYLEARNCGPKMHPALLKKGLAALYLP